MSYNTDIQSITARIQALIEKANTLPDSGGAELPTLTNPGDANTLLNGYELIGQDGNIISGAIPIKSSINFTISGHTLTVPSGYYSSAATARVSTTYLSTPKITVDSTGLITAVVTQLSSGYIASGSRSSTKQLSVLSAQTITPGTHLQRLSSGYYLTGAQTILGDSNLVPNNIVSGKSIFGVIGTAATGGGGTTVDDVSKQIIEGTITAIADDEIETIGSYVFYRRASLTTVSFPACRSIGGSAFGYCSSLTTVSFPVCTSIGGNAFSDCHSLTTASFPACRSIGGSAFGYCSSLTTVSFPVCTSIGGNAFYRCYSLTAVSFPVCTSIGSNAFYSCSSLTTVSFPVCTSIGSSAFYRCYSLTAVSFPVCTSIGGSAFYGCQRLSTLMLGASTVCTLANSNVFTSTPYAGYSSYFSGTPYIYVPASLLTKYQSATNWTYFSSYFRSLE